MTKTATTAGAAFFQGRKQEFDAAAANRALAVMRRGAVLHLQYSAGRRPSWSLGGRQISAAVASLIINSPLVVPADVALFPNLPAQTWRYIR